MKLTQTGLPRRFVRSMVPPPTWGTTRAGAGSPTWNDPFAVDGAGDPVGVTDGAARLGGGGSVLDGLAELDGIAADGPGTSGSGANATTPAISTTATAIPASRPATTDERAPKRDTHGRVPVRAGGGVSRGPLLPCRSHGRPRGAHPNP